MVKLILNIKEIIEFADIVNIDDVKNMLYNINDISRFSRIIEYEKKEEKFL